MSELLLEQYKKSLDVYKDAVEKGDEAITKTEATKMETIMNLMDESAAKKFRDKRTNIRRKLSEINDAIMELRDYEGLTDLMHIELLDIQTKMYDMMLDAL